MIRRGNKFGARHTVCAGRSFASKMEAIRGVELALLEQAGEITGLVYQPRLQLEPGIWFKPDFAYVERTGRVIHEDSKGVVTDRFRIIKKIWALHGPSTLRVTVTRRGRTRVIQEILPREKTGTAVPEMRPTSPAGTTARDDDGRISHSGARSAARGG